MNRLATAAAVVTMFALSAPAFGQTKSEAGTEPGMQSRAEARPDAPGSPPLLVQKLPDRKAKAKRRMQSSADARSCLQYATNLEVMICAEKYRWARG